MSFEEQEFKEPSFQEQVDLFVHGKSWRTQATYRSLAKSFQHFLNENFISFDNLAPSFLKAWITSFQKPNTQTTAKRFLSSYFRFNGNLSLVASLNATTKEIRPIFKFQVDLTLPEIMKIIDSCYDTAYKLAVSLMALNGLRVGEVLGLYWQDIDTQGNTVILQRREGMQYYPKGMLETDKPVKIPLNPVSRKFYLQLQKEIPDAAGRILPVSYKTLWKWFNRYVSEAGIRKRKYKLTPHKLRHAFAHLYLDNKGTLRKLQAVLRHKRIETTVIYTQPSTEELRSEFDLVISEKVMR